jgi:hypothetical protein
MKECQVANFHGKLFDSNGFGSDDFTIGAT